MINLLHISKGWARHLGILPISKELEALAEKRFEICKACTHAKQHKLLKVMDGKMNKIGSIYCTICKCPCHQKVLVEKEECPIGKW